MENVVCVQQSNEKKPKQNKNLQQNVKRENPCRTDTRAHLTHIWAPKTQISYRQTRACYGRRGMKNRYCKSKSVVHVAAAGRLACDFGGCLIWLCDVSQWSDDTVQGLWWTAALAATTNEQFAYVWPLASEHHSINHTSTIGAVSFVASLPISPSPSFPFAGSVSCPPLLSVSFSILPPPTYHLFSLPCLLLSFFSHNSTDRGFSKTAKGFYTKGSFASHSWCGGVLACFHKGRGRE